MEIELQNIPECILHKKEITHICSCGACQIPNPFICKDPECIKPHAHPMQQIISVAKLNQLLERNTSSMNMLIKKTKQYYNEIRQSLCHEIQKIQDMMTKALAYKHTHSVINLLKFQKYNEISPQKMVQLLSYLRGAKTQRKTMQFIKNQIYEVLEKLESEKKKLLNTLQFKKLMLVQLIDINSTYQMTIDNINTSTLDSQEEFKAISKMIQSTSKKIPTSWNLLYRASDHEFSAESYLLSIESRGPFLMIFKTDLNKKFGCFVNCKADKKQGWLTDGPGFSFVFSLDHNEIFQIKKEAKYRVKAFYIGDKGPQIGCGCDIYISNKCNQNKQSGSNLGGSFELPNKLVYGSQGAKEYLTGEQNFCVLQYEIFQIK